MTYEQRAKEENSDVMGTLTMASASVEVYESTNLAKSDSEAVEVTPASQCLTCVDLENETKEAAGDIVAAEIKVVEAKSEEDRNQKPVASLYCPRNGRSHATLLDFGITECPKCDQGLISRRYHPYESSESDESSTSSDDEGSVAASENQENDNTSPAITYSLEYRDAGDYHISTVPWVGPFDLSAARKDLKEKERIIFDIVTVLETSIPEDSHRYPSEKAEILDKGIVDNPNIQLKVSSTKLAIRSKALLRVFATVVTYYPEENFQRDLLELNEPYPLIGHYLGELEAYRATYNNSDLSPTQEGAKNRNNAAQPACDKEVFDHLGLLFEFLKNSHYTTHITDEQERHTRNLCTFRMLWLLFKPGETVYMESGGQLYAYVIRSMEVGKRILSTTSRALSPPYVIELWNLDFDGHFVGRTSTLVTIAHFDGERQVTSLKIFPCEFIDRQDGGKTRRNLEALGAKWYSYLRGRQLFYSGELIGPPKRQFQGRVYVDSTSYYAQNSHTAPNICEVDDMGEELANCLCEECHGRRPHPLPGFRWADYDLLDPNVKLDLELPGSPEGPRHRYLLCSRVMHGFILKSRTWAKLNNASCSEPKVNKKAIDSLVMPEARKEMIRALVQKFTDPSGEKSAKSWGADFIENKGEGQIFLLHGSPGVGKTFTAGKLNIIKQSCHVRILTQPECIAEYTGRAMLSLTCGDIGTDEVEMENQLSRWFRLAEKWGAVMLIDEADVYLERRQITDLKRNSLVSVFLRCIEYYRGILFLTTNRVGHFDDAFISRIHVVIRYDNLKDEDRKRIWEQFFDKLTDERDDFIITRRAKSYVLEDDVISKMEWNGREIRNAFQTAVALAEYRFSQKPDKSKDDGPTLDQKDLEQVCNMTREFKEYLTKVHGVDEEFRAFQAKARAADGIGN